MKKIKQVILKIPFSVTIYHFFKKIYNYPSFTKDFFAYMSLDTEKRFDMSWFNQFPCLLDKTPLTGFEPHYIYHPAWAFRIVVQNKPIYHVDISSTLHFCSMVSAVIPVKFYDYRPAPLKLSGLTSEKGDLMHLPFENNSLQSLSCLHTIEHVGLGRYGDPIDPEGDRKAAKELQRVVAPGGSLLVVTPIGKPRIEFNAHRIYSYEMLLSLFPDMKLKEFSFVPDDYIQYGLMQNASPAFANTQQWGCGCFWFVKE